MANIVLVHGAWQGGWIWGRLSSRLAAMGHNVYAPSLDGCGDRRSNIRPGITVETQATEMADLLTFEDLEQVVLVGTSVGGMVVCKTAEIARKRIGKLVFLDAVTLFDGEDFGSALTRPTAIVEGSGFFVSKKHAAEQMFRHFDDQTRTWALNRLTPHPIGVVREKAHLPTFWKQEWDASVIWCKQAPNPGEARQRRTAEALGAAFYELDDSHYPMITSPDKLAELVTISL